MVHLAGMSARKEGNEDHIRRRSSMVPGMEHISLEAPGDDEFSTSVYGSRFAAQDLPSHEMPEREMPKEIAYRMIKDELSLDGNPMLKSVSNPPLQDCTANDVEQSSQLRHHVHGKYSTSGH
jgi:glutamate decarboxylase